MGVVGEYCPLVFSHLVRELRTFVHWKEVELLHDRGTVSRSNMTYVFSPVLILLDS